MKLKALLVVVAVIFSLFWSAGPVFAYKWVYVGTLSLSSGASRVDYVDVENVVKDQKNDAIIFWVMSETKALMHLRKLTKYMTKLDLNRSTKSLEWHVYDADGHEIMYTTQAQQDWEYPEEFSLLGRAIDIAEDNAK